MVRRNLAIALVLLATFSLLAAAGDDKNAGNQTVCPVMGNPINKEVYTDYQGYRIFFCCEGCIEKFKEDAAANLEKMKADGVEPMKLAAQTTCPLTGNPIDKDVFVDHEGMRVYLCCPGCAEKGGSGQVPEGHRRQGRDP